MHGALYILSGDKYWARFGKGPVIQQMRTGLQGPTRYLIPNGFIGITFSLPSTSSSGNLLPLPSGSDPCLPSSQELWCRYPFTRHDIHGWSPPEHAFNLPHKCRAREPRLPWIVTPCFLSTLYACRLPAFSGLLTFFLQFNVALASQLFACTYSPRRSLVSRLLEHAMTFRFWRLNLAAWGFLLHTPREVSMNLVRCLNNSHPSQQPVGGGQSTFAPWGLLVIRLPVPDFKVSLR